MATYGYGRDSELRYPTTQRHRTAHGYAAILEGDRANRRRSERACHLSREGYRLIEERWICRRGKCCCSRRFNLDLHHMIAFHVGSNIRAVIVERIDAG